MVAYFQANAETADVFAIRLPEKIKKAVEAWAKRESNVRQQNAPNGIWLAREIFHARATRARP